MTLPIFTPSHGGADAVNISHLTNEYKSLQFGGGRRYYKMFSGATNSDRQRWMFRAKIRLGMDNGITSPYAAQPVYLLRAGSAGLAIGADNYITYYQNATSVKLTKPYIDSSYYCDIAMLYDSAAAVPANRFRIWFMYGSLHYVYSIGDSIPLNALSDIGSNNLHVIGLETSVKDHTQIYFPMFVSGSSFSSSSFRASYLDYSPISYTGITANGGPNATFLTGEESGTSMINIASGGNWTRDGAALSVLYMDNPSRCNPWWDPKPRVDQPDRSGPSLAKRFIGCGNTFYPNITYPYAPAITALPLIKPEPGNGKFKKTFVAMTVSNIPVGYTQLVGVVQVPSANAMPNVDNDNNIMHSNQHGFYGILLTSVAGGIQITRTFINAAPFNVSPITIPNSSGGSVTIILASRAGGYLYIGYDNNPPLSESAQSHEYNPTWLTWRSAHPNVITTYDSTDGPEDTFSTGNFQALAPNRNHDYHPTTSGLGTVRLHGGPTRLFKLKDAPNYSVSNYHSLMDVEPDLYKQTLRDMRQCITTKSSGSTGAQNLVFSVPGYGDSPEVVSMFTFSNSGTLKRPVVMDAISPTLRYRFGETTNQTSGGTSISGHTVYLPGNDTDFNLNGNSYTHFVLLGHPITQSRTLVNGLNVATKSCRTQGFAVFRYTGNGVNTQTVRHYLGVEPTMVIIKPLTGSGAGHVWHRAMPNTTYACGMDLDSNQSTSRQILTGVNSTYISLHNSSRSNQSGVEYVMYAFTDTPGLIKTGYYDGNEETSTTFPNNIYNNTNFNPTMIMAFRIGTGGNEGGPFIYLSSAGRNGIVYSSYTHHSRIAGYDTNIKNWHFSNGFVASNGSKWWGGFAEYAWIAFNGIILDHSVGITQIYGRDLYGEGMSL